MPAFAGRTLRVTNPGSMSALAIYHSLRACPQKFGESLNIKTLQSSSVLRPAQSAGAHSVLLTSGGRNEGGDPRAPGAEGDEPLHNLAPRGARLPRGVLFPCAVV